MGQRETEGNDTIPDDELNVVPEGVEPRRRKWIPDESSQTDDRGDGPDAPETQTGQVEPQGGETPRVVQSRIITAL